jgi:hypothetical protein
VTCALKSGNNVPKRAYIVLALSERVILSQIVVKTSTIAMSFHKECAHTSGVQKVIPVWNPSPECHVVHSIPFKKGVLAKCCVHCLPDDANIGGEPMMVKTRNSNGSMMLIPNNARGVSFLLKYRDLDGHFDHKENGFLIKHITGTGYPITKLDKSTAITVRMSPRKRPVKTTKVRDLLRQHAAHLLRPDDGILDDADESSTGSTQCLGIFDYWDRKSPSVYRPASITTQPNETPYLSDIKREYMSDLFPQIKPHQWPIPNMDAISSLPKRRRMSYGHEDVISDNYD